MKSVPFEYRAPATLEETLALLGKPGANVVPLAGGQSLLPLLALRQVRPATVLDLNRVPGLAGVEITDEVVRIGALTRLRALVESAPLRAALPVLPETAAQVANRQIRHRSTLGGSLCHADPTAQLPAVAVALEARLWLRSARAERSVLAQDFFAGARTTARRRNELLVRVEFPRTPGRHCRFEAVTRRGRAGFPLIGLCLAVSLAGSVVTDARLAASGIADRPRRLWEAERALTGRRLDGDLAEVLDAASAEADPSSDLHGSAEYRSHLLRTVIRRAAARLATEGSAP
ncbi:xanthine dehydrogenase family protein subunit M [Kitasatospora sp. GP82]|uniref:FAD binding domain-containing protein n=1 Tax=Kitasatospora sp. GP82 TaxID=3035089 RepID=UPI0024763D36|nr:xanthine dehydrogenase family protein subunit M [Kitasatospora sp. GP82]MDH6128349.1 carbon-monoxide dehydrogenase medium subunit [Kitasatospora sp. GP82]